jgi:hypothetical protein
MQPSPSSSASSAPWATSSSSSRWPVSTSSTTACSNWPAATRTGRCPPIRSCRKRNSLPRSTATPRPSTSAKSAPATSTPCFVAHLVGGQRVGLVDATRFVGYREEGDTQALLFENHGLHIEIQTDPHHPVGRSAPGSVADVVLESAVTTIQDCEDSVAAVDAEDKVGVYRNWLGLMTGQLTAEFDKGGKTMTRTLADDRRYTASDGSELVLPGRSLMLVRNVGHLMSNDAVLDDSGAEIFEGILDAVVTAGCALANRRTAASTSSSRSSTAQTRCPLRWSYSPHRGRCGSRAQHAQDRRSWTRSAAPPSISRSASAPRATGHLHQHRLPRPHRRRDPHDMRAGP